MIDFRKPKRPEPPPEANVVRGPWDRPAEPKVRPPTRSPLRPPVWKRSPMQNGARRGAREPMVNNWGRLLIMLGLVFVLPSVATWLVRWLMGMLTGQG